jgi:hypothetical protein
MVGPLDEVGEESFDFIVCSPDWMFDQMPGNITMGLHYIFMKRFDHTQLEAFVERYCATCEGPSWRDVAQKVGRLGKWEFEEYEPSGTDPRGMRLT